MSSILISTSTPLKSLLTINEAYYSHSIYTLGKGSGRNPRSIARILNALYDNNLRTLEALLNSSLDDLSKLRNFGSTGQEILLELLENFMIGG